VADGAALDVVGIDLSAAGGGAVNRAAAESQWTLNHMNAIASAGFKQEPDGRPVMKTFSGICMQPADTRQGKVPMRLGGKNSLDSTLQRADEACPRPSKGCRIPVPRPPNVPPIGTQPAFRAR
jgi:hypothetical protein